FLADTRRFARQARVSLAAFQATRRGDSLPVRYASSDPTVSRLLLEGEKSGPIWMVAFVPLLLAALIAATIVRSLFWQRRLLRFGHATAAIVTRTRGVKSGTAVHFRFLDRSDGIVDGMSLIGIRQSEPDE